MRILEFLCFAEYIWKLLENRFVLAVVHTAYGLGFEHVFQNTECISGWLQNCSVCFFQICWDIAAFRDKACGRVTLLIVAGRLKGSRQHWLIPVISLIRCGRALRLSGKFV